MECTQRGLRGALGHCRNKQRGTANVAAPVGLSSSLSSAQMVLKIGRLEFQLSANAVQSSASRHLTWWSSSSIVSQTGLTLLCRDQKHAAAGRAIARHLNSLRHNVD